MPKVRASSGTMGTTRGPTVLSRSSAVSSRTKAIVVEISRPRLPLELAREDVDAGGRERLGAVRAGGEKAAEGAAPLLQVLDLRAVGRGAVEGSVRDLVVGEGDLEPVPERPERVLPPSSSAGG